MCIRDSSSAEKALSLVENGRHSLQPELQIARAAALRSMARWQEAMDAYGMAIDRSVETGNTGQAVPGGWGRRCGARESSGRGEAGKAPTGPREGGARAGAKSAAVTMMPA